MISTIEDLDKFIRWAAKNNYTQKRVPCTKALCNYCGWQIIESTEYLFMGPFIKIVEDGKIFEVAPWLVEELCELSGSR